MNLINLFQKDQIMTNIKIENLKEKYDSIYQIYSNLPKELQKGFFYRLKERKELKTKALSRTTLTSRNFLLLQSSKRIQEIHKDILEVKKEEDTKKYKLESQNLKNLFDKNKLTPDEKLYLAKQTAKRNSFDESEFIAYIQSDLKLIGKSIGNDIEQILTMGLLS